MSQSLAVRYRPPTLDDVVEQSSTVRILKQQLQTGDLQHCYLFSGISGSGKSTCARAFSYEINGGVGQPLEIDAASNSGVDNVRALIKDAYERSITGQYKIIILDECQALSSAAWQAFLKCIEEPPAHTIFIFCTTDPQKLPATILNRMQKFNFTKISLDGIKNRLKFVCEQEGFTNYQEAIDYIARLANGCMRDALTMLDKCVDYSRDLAIQNVFEALGNFSYPDMFALINALIDGNEGEVLKRVSTISDKGSDLKLFVDQFLTFTLDLAKYALFKNMELLQIPASFEEDVKNATNFEAPEKYYSYVVDKLLDLKNMIKGDSNITSTVEVIMLRIARCQ